MRRIIATLALLLSVMAGAMAQNDAMYIYRNDGGINAFLKSEIDSITYSNMDMDGMFHTDYVTQEVWTEDSVYRIPLEVIDSVSMVTPPTKYKEGVVRMDADFLDYVIGSEGTTLKMKSDTPFFFIPKTGDKLVLLEGTDVLPNGFAGIVRSVQTAEGEIDVICDKPYLEDLFDSYCSVVTTYGGKQEDMPAANGKRRVTYNPRDFVIPLGPYHLSRSGEISQGIIPSGDLALKGGAAYSVDIQPTFRIHTFLIIGEGHGTYFQCSITGTLEVSSNTSIYGGIEYSHEFLNPVMNVPIPPTAGLVNFYINPGLFLRASATVTSTLSLTNVYTFGMAFDYSSKGENSVKPYHGGRLASSSVDMTGCIDGSLAGGAYIETGFNIESRDFAKVCVRGEYGWQISGNFVLRNSDIDAASKETKLYERLKSSSIQTGPFVNTSMQASVFNTSASINWELSRDFKNWDVVPTFSNTKFAYSSSSPSSADASTELSGKCLLPVTVGYKVFDGDKNEIDDYDANTNYYQTASKLSHTFSNLKRSKDYTLYPKVKLFGYDILASPSAELEKGEVAHITDFTQAGSKYSKGAYYNDGRYYDYKYDVKVTAEIESLDGIADWGYVYEDSYGNVKHISLKQYGTSYTDTRYAYYRNEATSSVTLYGYVKYYGDEEYYYDEPHVYELRHKEEGTSCPDDHHPHVIDLGLGVKWACCNVGANSPEGYGGYYAWGETKEKDIYELSTYKWYGSENTMTKYCADSSRVDNKTVLDPEDDAAHVNWGGNWRMPTFAEQDELCNKCTWTWTTQNGVFGSKVTGPNGNSIFLPASGYGYDSSSNEFGLYWSSSLLTGGSYVAYCLYFNSGFVDWDYGLRIGGFSVRAVCP